MVCVGFMVFNATFNNISVTSWRSALFVEETGIPRENHRLVAILKHWNYIFWQHSKNSLILLDVSYILKIRKEQGLYMIDSDRRPVFNRRPLLKSVSTDVIISNHGSILGYSQIGFLSKTLISIGPFTRSKFAIKITVMTVFFF